MIKDIRYIIKRIIIGFAIGVLMFLFRSTFAFADSVELENARYTYMNSAMTSNAAFANATRVNAFTGVWLKGQPRMKTGLNKVAFEIKNNDYFSNYKNSPYNYSFYIIVEDPGGGGFTNTLPNVEFNSVSCQVMTSYWNANGSVDGDNLSGNFRKPGDIYGGWFGVVCPDITLTSNTSYVNIYFQNYDILGTIPFDFYIARYWNVSRSGTIDAMYQLIDLERAGNQIANSQSNAIQTQTEEVKKQTQAINNLNNNLTSEDIDTSGYNSLSNNNANNGVINQLITMPITLAQSYLNGFNSSCTPFSLGTLYGEELILPCINPGNYLGNLWTIIDVIISGVFIFVFGKKLVKIFNDVTNLKENQVNEVFD